MPTGRGSKSEEAVQTSLNWIRKAGERTGELRWSGPGRPECWWGAVAAARPQTGPGVARASAPIRPGEGRWLHTLTRMFQMSATTRESVSLFAFMILQTEHSW